MTVDQVDSFPVAVDLLGDRAPQEPRHNRIMVRAVETESFEVDGIHLAPVYDMVDMEVEPAAVIRNGGPRAGLSERVHEIILRKHAEGGAAGNVVEITRHNHILDTDGVNLVPQHTGLVHTGEESVGEFGVELGLGLATSLAGTVAAGDFALKLLVGGIKPY